MKRLIAEPITLQANKAQSLDQLWHEAEQIGRVSVDNTFLSDTYRVRIRFERRSGTTIWAEGKNTNIAFALADAINEAREMGAGVPQ